MKGFAPPPSDKPLELMSAKEKLMEEKQVEEARKQWAYEEELKKIRQDNSDRRDQAQKKE